MLWWPLVDAGRVFFLTGLLALVEPGTLLQLFCGVVFALCFTSLQSFSAPYRMETNNFLAYIANVAIVLNLLGSLGTQINAKYVAGAVNSTLLSAALFTRETFGKALAVRTKDIDAAEDEPLLHSVSSHAISFARESSQHLQSHLDSLTPKP